MSGEQPIKVLGEFLEDIERRKVCITPNDFSYLLRLLRANSQGQVTQENMERMKRLFPATYAEIEEVMRGRT